MTLSFYCSSCQQGYLVVGSFEELSGLKVLLECKDCFSCITPFCRGEMKRVPSWPSSGVKTVHELPLRSFYRAIHGFGSGEGDPADAEEFKRLLTTKKISELKVTAVGQPERVIVHQLILEDGTRMHFDSSAKGACCYYIEKPGKTCVEVVEDELAADETVVPGTGEDREEIGRGNEGAVNAECQVTGLILPFDAIPQATGTEPVQFVWDDPDVQENRDT